MHALIAAAVINDRHRQRLAKALEDRMGVMRRRHKIDIVRPLGNELEVDFPQPLDGDLDTLSSFGDLIVLTSAVIFVPPFAAALGFETISLAEFGVSVSLAVAIIPILRRRQTRRSRKAS